METLFYFGLSHISPTLGAELLIFLFDLEPEALSQGTPMGRLQRLLQVPWPEKKAHCPSGLKRGGQRPSHRLRALPTASPGPDRPGGVGGGGNPGR